jgi:hypothetical protein
MMPIVYGTLLVALGSGFWRDVVLAHRTKRRG